MVADINVDMFLPIVPLKVLRVLGLNDSSLGDLTRQIAASHDVQVQPDPEPLRNLFIRSDQYNFIKRGIPSIIMDVSFTPGIARAGAVQGLADAALPCALRRPESAREPGRGRSLRADRFVNFCSRSRTRAAGQNGSPTASSAVMPARACEGGRHGKVPWQHGSFGASLVRGVTGRPARFFCRAAGRRSRARARWCRPLPQACRHGCARCAGSATRSRCRAGRSA